MSVMASRRVVGAGFLAGLASLVARGASAQFTEQEVIQGADVVSTGDVNINQSASASQDATFGVYVDGRLVTEDGVYQSDTGQVVIQNGRVVATGDVTVNQSASASQSSDVSVTWPEHDGDDADYCSPGAVIANPNTGQLFYQKDDCCWYAACANGCKKKGCEGDLCG